MRCERAVIMSETRNPVLDRVQRIFREVLEDDSLTISLQTTQAQLITWDSVAQIRLVLSIEEEFGLYFSARETGELVSVRAIVSQIEAKTAKM
jgi:acyl carrier protein